MGEEWEEKYYQLVMHWYISALSINQYYLTYFKTEAHCSLQIIIFLLNIAFFIYKWNIYTIEYYIDLYSL